MFVLLSSLFPPDQAVGGPGVDRAVLQGDEPVRPARTRESASPGSEGHRYGPAASSSAGYGASVSKPRERSDSVAGFRVEAGSTHDVALRDEQAGRGAHITAVDEHPLSPTPDSSRRGRGGATEVREPTRRSTPTAPAEHESTDARAVVEADTPEHAPDYVITRAARLFLVDSGRYGQTDVADAIEQRQTTSREWAVVWLRMPDASEIAVLLMWDRQTEEWTGKASGPPFEEATVVGVPGDIRRALR